MVDQRQLGEEAYAALCITRAFKQRLSMRKTQRWWALRANAAEIQRRARARLESVQRRQGALHKVKAGLSTVMFAKKRQKEHQLYKDLKAARNHLAARKIGVRWKSLFHTKKLAERVLVRTKLRIFGSCIDDRRPGACDRDLLGAAGSRQAATLPA